jgi:SPP1 gp7 family putative phage head morphogenesis protein
MAKTVPVGDGIPPEFYRNAIDLNRFSNSVSKKLVTSYNNVMLKAVEKLKIIEGQPLNERPAYKTARLRALIKQTKESLNSWANGSVDDLIADLEGVAKVQAGFVESQLKKSIPKGMAEKIHDQIGYSFRSVAVSPSFAKSVVVTDPTAINLAVLKSELAGITKDKKARTKGTFKLTAKEGQTITLPNGNTVKKSFLGIAEAEAKRLNQVVRSGLLSGDTTPEIVRELVGNLKKDQKGSLSQLLAQGGAATKSANNQVMTIVRTTVNQVTNTASQAVYKANPDVTEEYRYVATLDSRTSPVCRDLDGQVFKYNQGPVPPQHFGCRSTTVAVVNYKKWDFTPPPAGRRASVGGPVPANTTYGKWLYGERAKGSKFKPGVEQIKALGEQKAKYFNRLSNKYGPDQALKKLIREDNTEVSLAQLQKRYGKPEDIKAKVTKKKAATPKIPVETLATTKATTETWQPTSDFKEGIRRGESMTKGRFGKTKSLAKEYKKAFDDYEKASEKYFTYSYSEAKKEAAKLLGPLASRDEVIKFYRDERIKLKQIWVKNKAALTKLEIEGAKEMAILRKETLKTTVTDKQIKERLDSIPFTNQKKADRLKVRSEVEEFAKIFNGGGVTVKSEGALDGQISKVKLGTSRANNNWKGEILVPFADPQNSYMELLSKQTVFHEIGHSLETSRKANLNMAVNWRTSRVTSNAPTKTKVKKAWTLSEGVLPDEFITPYVGRPYRSRNRGYKQGFTDTATEVISMGVEHFASPELMFRLYSVDPDHFHMILSLTRNVYGG